MLVSKEWLTTTWFIIILPNIYVYIICVCTHIWKTFYITRLNIYIIIMHMHVHMSYNHCMYLLLCCFGVPPLLESRAFAVYTNLQTFLSFWQWHTTNRTWITSGIFVFAFIPPTEDVNADSVCEILLWATKQLVKLWHGILAPIFWEVCIGSVMALKEDKS